MLCADPTRCRPRRPCRISSRTPAMGSRADRPPPSATIAPSGTRAIASARLSRLSPRGCRLMVILRDRASASAPAVVRSCRDKEPGQARPARSVDSARARVTLAGMSQTVQDEVGAVVQRAREAARAIEHYTQEQVDELVTAMAWAVVRKDHAEELARLAVDEGGFGNYADKVAKIHKRVTGVLADMTGLRTVGVVEELPEAGLVKIAKPVGVVAALIPVTGPDATPPVKALFAVKGRNAIICAPHPRTAGTTEAVVAYMREACEQVGAPADLVQSMPEPSLAKSQELMRQADLVVATGGAGMVHAAYSSGTPAYGVGVGNSVHVIDQTADLADAASAILAAKTFDSATSCLADNALIVHADVYDDLMRRLTEAGAHLCDEREKHALRAVMWPPGGPVPASAGVAKPAARIAGLAGFGVPDSCPMLLVEETGAGPDHPFSGEKLSVVLGVY